MKRLGIALTILVCTLVAYLPTVFAEEAVKDIWTFTLLGMDMRQIAMYLVTVIALLMVVLLYIKSK